jgi:sortase A
MKVSEIMLWILGTTLLAFYFGASYWGEHQRREGLASFAEVREIAPVEWPRDSQAGDVVPAGLPAGADVEAAQDAVIAVLRIPGIELEVPVYQGTTEHVLRRGAGLVEGTAFPGSMGNVGIAAHRDTHFPRSEGRGDRRPGRVGHAGPDRGIALPPLEVVGPSDVHVLDDTGESVLTLVTCYPFYFVGNAPQRYIVRATVADGSM